MSQQFKIPESVKHEIHCPLCNAVFALRRDATRVKDFVLCGPCNTAEPVGKDTKNACPQCGRARQSHRTDGLVLHCGFCRIRIMAADPLVGRWEELYARGEMVKCDACIEKGIDTVMRFFATSSGLVVLKCPLKTCGFELRSALPDRAREERPRLTDESGEPLFAPAVDHAVATVEQPAVTQLMESPETIKKDTAKSETLQIDLPKE